MLVGTIDCNLHFVFFHCMRQEKVPLYDDPAVGFSVVTQLANIINNAMSPTCATNVISLICSSFFKECVRVQDESSGDDLWLPSLLCRRTCKKHLEIWKQCLKDLESVPVAKSNFDRQMMSLVRQNDVCGLYTVEADRLFGLHAQVNTISVGALLILSTGDLL